MGFALLLTIFGVTHEGMGQTSRAYRFRILHETVDSVFARVLAEFDATLVSLPSEDSTRILRLLPADGRCAAITVAYDDFPGLAVRFGRWYVENIPTCGCDYCDDDETELALDLREQIEAVVRTGFSEQPSGDSIIGTFRTLGEDPRRSTRRSSHSSQRNNDPPGADLPEPSGSEWLPWPMRTVAP
jgi:hypothetical protein